MDNTAENPITIDHIELKSYNTKKQSFSNKPNNTIFGAEANNSVTGKIEPSYTSQSQK
jgi:hypothetical protein